MGETEKPPSSETPRDAETRLRNAGLRYVRYWTRAYVFRIKDVLTGERDAEIQTIKLQLERIRDELKVVLLHK